MTKRIASFGKGLTASLCLLFLMVLMFGACCYTVEFDFHDFYGLIQLERRSLFSSIVTTAAIVFFGIILFCIVQRGLSRLSERRQYRLMIGVIAMCTLTILAASLWWIGFNESTPLIDQKNCYEMAIKIATGKEAFSEFEFDYIERNPHQRGLILIFVLLYKFFGEGFLPFRMLNVIALCVLVVGLSVLSYQIYRRILVTIITAVVFVLFVPLLFYTSFLYGTILAPALAVSGLCCSIAWIQTEKKRYMLPPIILIPMAIQAYTSYNIFLIAFLLMLFGETLICIAKKQNIYLFVIVMIMTLGIHMLVSSAVDIIFGRMTGLRNTGGMPASSYIYMGITSTEEDGLWGPGSWDGTNARLYEDGERTTEKVSQLATELIRKRLGDIMGTHEAAEFFLMKTWYQWLEPSFGGLKEPLNQTEGEVYSDSFAAFSSGGGPRPKIQRMLKLCMPAVYLLAMWSTVAKLRKRESEHLYSWFGELYFVGGFLFQLAWETRPRYCLPYYLFVLCIAVYGLTALSDLVMGHMKTPVSALPPGD